MDPIKSIENFFTSPLFVIFSNMFLLFLVAFWIALSYWTYQDSKRRGANAAYWATVSLIFPIFGWIVYLTARPPEYLDDVKERELEIKSKEATLQRALVSCPACHKPIESDFLICPHCRKKLKNSCSKCNRALDLKWEICPYCKESVAG